MTALQAVPTFPPPRVFRDPRLVHTTHLCWFCFPSRMPACLPLAACSGHHVLVYSTHSLQVAFSPSGSVER